MDNFFKLNPIKTFVLFILFLLLLSNEPSDVSFKSLGNSSISILKALVFGLELKADAFVVIILLFLISYLITCLIFYIFSEEAIRVFKRKKKR
jgi:signal transduction histidine kinase